MILALLFLTTGCSAQNLNDLSIEDCANYVINSDVNIANINKVGYRYYLPRGFSVINDVDYNETLISDGNKYYMYIDIVSYYNNKTPTYNEDSNAYFSKKIKANNKEAKKQIREENEKIFIENNYILHKKQVKVEEKENKEPVTKKS